MYKLIIADDERIIRSGLKNIIDWNNLGFEVTDLFSDGQEVIESLNSITPDVILTDIKMVFASGLDVAQYVFENKLSTTVVFISGYQEFDLALKGMKFGVTDYLLKPINVEELENTFRKIKEKLDREKSRSERMEEAIPLLKEHLFTDLILGSVTDRHSFIKNRFELIYPGLHPESCSCFLSDIRICNYEQFIAEVWNYTQDQLEQNLINFLNIYHEDYVFHLVYKSGDLFEIVGILKNQHADKNSCLSLLDQMKTDLEQTFLFSCTYTLLNYYESVYELGQISTFIQKNQPFDLQASKFEEQKKLIVSNIFMGNIGAAQKIFSSTLSELNSLHIPQRNTQIIGILETIHTAIKNTNETLSQSLSSYFDYSAIFALQSTEEIDNYCSRIFDRISMAKKKNELSETGHLITKAKSYIQDHIYQDISQEEIANQLFICPAYLSRLFKKVTGENFSQYVTRLKMEQAITLLKDPHYKTYQVGELLGYKTPRYFSRLFRAQTGLNPTEYRKTLLNIEETSDEE